MSLNDDERAELEALRADKADRLNPNVRLIEGQLMSSDDEGHDVTSIETSVGTHALVKIIEDLLEWPGKKLTVCWHMSSEPFGFHQLQEHMIKKVMGVVETKFWHSYSDLTGYLWTTEELKVGGHDVLAEINAAKSEIPTWPIYVAIRVEREPQ